MFRAGGTLKPFVDTDHGIVRWADVVHILRDVEEEWDDSYTAAAGDQTDDKSDDPCESTIAILQTGLDLSALTVGNGDRYLLEDCLVHHHGRCDHRCHHSWLRLLQKEDKS